MRDIASAAQLSTGITYRYFASKEDLVIVLYEKIANELVERAANLPAGDLGELFSLVIRAKLELLQPYRSAFSALFATSLDQENKIGVLSANSSPIRQANLDCFKQIVAKAAPTPPAEKIESVAQVLYGLHLALVFFWLQDRTPAQKATSDLIDFSAEMLGLLQGVLEIPAFKSILDRLANILTPVLNLSVAGNLPDSKSNGSQD